MIKNENDCCDCHIPAYQCIGEVCPLKESKHYYCDNCGDETKIFHFDGQELCIDCVKNQLDEVI